LAERSRRVIESGGIEGQEVAVMKLEEHPTVRRLSKQVQEGENQQPAR